MPARLGAIPIIVDRGTVQDADEGDRNPPNRYDPDESIGSEAKGIDREDAAVEGED